MAGTTGGVMVGESLWDLSKNRFLNNFSNGFIVDRLFSRPDCSEDGDPLWSSCSMERGRKGRSSRERGPRGDDTCR